MKRVDIEELTIRSVIDSCSRITLFGFILALFWLYFERNSVRVRHFLQKR